MSKQLVHAEEMILLVGGGDVDPEEVTLFQRDASACVAVDSGADAVLLTGRAPDHVIGDLDSLSDSARDILRDQLIHIREQDTTDFEKALSRVNAPVILGLGFLGGQLDHELAALSVLARYPDKCCILIGAQDVIAHVPAHLTLELAADTRVSLFPLTTITGRSSGLAWPLDGVTLSPLGQIGTSNYATGPVTLDMDRAGCLILLPRTALDALITGLRASL